MAHPTIKSPSSVEDLESISINISSKLDLLAEINCSKYIFGSPLSFVMALEIKSKSVLINSFQKEMKSTDEYFT